MLPIMAKLNIILRSQYVNTWEFCNHAPDFEDFSIPTPNNDFKVTLMKSLLINGDHPPLNKNKQSFPLELFDS